VDVEGRIQYANPAARAMYGYDPGELAGQNVRIFQPPGRRPLADDILRASAEGVWQGEVNVLRKDGSELPVHLTASVVRDEADEARREATAISEEAKRVAKILDGPLGVSRIEAGTSHLKLARIPVDEVVGEIVRSFAEQGSEHRFAVDVSEATPLVSADRERLKQILDNLLSNAVKFTPGGGQIRVAISARDDAAVVSVADEGPGIPSAEL